MLGPFCILWRGIKYFAQFAFLTRFAILYLIILLLLASCAWRDWSLVLRNVFLVETKTKIFWLSLMSFLSVALCLSTIRVTLLGGHLRFKDFEEGGDYQRLAPEPRFTVRDSVLWGVAWFVFGSLVPAACLIVNSRQNALGEYVAWPMGSAMMLTAGLLTAGLLWVASHLGGAFGFGNEKYQLTPFDRIVDSSEPGRFAGVSRIILEHWPGKTWQFSRGYFTKDKDGNHTFAPGHWEMAFAVFILVILTFALYYGGGKPLDPWLPTLYYLLLVLCTLQLILSAAAFFFDYWRVPTLFVVLVYLIFTNRYWPTDHFFLVKAVSTSKALESQQKVATLPDFLVTLPADTRKEECERTLVLVNAAGGGIQAAAWTARVLTGLHEAYPSTFARATLVISGVSGGSVGAMFYLAGAEGMRSEEQKAREEAAHAINEMVRRSGLEATGWGLAFPDFWRIALAPIFFASKDEDRGKSLERVWRGRLDLIEGSLRGQANQPCSWCDMSMRQFAERQIESKANPPAKRDPIVLFNTTLIGSGKRFVVGPFAILDKTSESAEEFVSAYPDYDMDLVTATRMSASFSYVSPISRPLLAGERPNPCFDWLADGGYSDNEGIMTSIDVLKPVLLHLLQTPRDARPFDRVVVLRILPFPEVNKTSEQTGPEVTQSSEPKCPEELEKARNGSGLVVFGPIQLLINTRQTTQIDRGTRALELIRVLLTSAGPSAAAEALDDTSTNRANARAPSKMERMAQWRASQAAQRLSQLQQPIRPGAESLPERDDTVKDEGANDPVEFGFVNFRFEVKPKEGQDQYEPPLSWKLSVREKEEIDAAWRYLREQKPEKPLEIKVISDGSAGTKKSLDDIFGSPQPLPKADAPATAK